MTAVLLMTICDLHLRCRAVPPLCYDTRANAGPTDGISARRARLLRRQQVNGAPKHLPQAPPEAAAVALRLLVL